MSVKLRKEFGPIVILKKRRKVVYLQMNFKPIKEREKRIAAHPRPWKPHRKL